MREPQLVYILAASHSGSTLSAMLLNSHPEICTVGELKATNLGDAEQYRCSCQQLLSDCDFWKGVSAAMEKMGHEYDVRYAMTSLHEMGSAYVHRLLRPLHRPPLLEHLRDAALTMSPTWRRELPLWAARNADLVRCVADMAGVPTVVDSSKIAMRLKYLSRMSGLRIRVIRLVRDGRGVALTYMRPTDFADASNPELRGGGSGATTHEHLSMVEAAMEWRRSNEEAAAVLATIPAADAMQVSYEAMCNDTAGTLGEIYQFLGLDVSTNYRHFRESSHHVVGNGMRLDSGSEIRLDERWRNVLDASELRQFDDVAGSLNRSLGYE